MLEQILHQIRYYLLVWDRLVIPPIWLILEVLGIAAALHALLNKRDPRAALGWTAVCLFVPGIGALLYLLFGINRIQTRAQRLHSQGHWEFSKKVSEDFINLDLATHPVPFEVSTFLSLMKVSDTVTRLPLMKGCRLEALFNGEQAYPRMLAAIREAQQRIFLGTYIFETNRIGQEFVDALSAAVQRGVQVRVLVDGVGTRYSRPPIQKLLGKAGIPYALFLPLTLSPRSIHLNLRTHRKIMVVDGKVGFTGGMNLGDRHLVDDPENKNPTQDIHFQVTGPVLAQLQEAFLMDWYFSKKESRDEENFPVSQEERGEALCRGILAGPNEDFEKLRWIINGVLSCAQKKVRIMTPYFIPDTEMMTALNSAALRGVDIEIILPEKNNLPYMKWATQALIKDLLRYRIKIYYQPPPFAHSKLLVVDDFYSLVGSANLDPRSLILNFEFNLEVFDRELAKSLTEHYNRIRSVSQAVTLETLRQRNFGAQLRDSFAKLFSPYL